MKKILATVLIIIFGNMLNAYSVTSTIQMIDSIEEAKDELQRATPRTLIVFDIDETLIHNFALGLFVFHTPQAAGKADVDFVNKARAKVTEYAKKIGGDRMNDLYISFCMMKGKSQLIEYSVLNLIRYLQDRQIKIIALTASPAGTFGCVPCGRHLRYANLTALGIDFSHSFNQEEIVFDTLNKYNGDYPMFYKGILLANYKNDKGSVLGALLDSTGWYPEKVIFFDDRKSHLEDVSIDMNQRGISFQGYWCQAWQNVTRPPFDRTIAEIQLDYLLNHDTFLSAKEASDLLHSKMVSH